MELVQNPIQALQDMFLKPNRVFATIAKTHNWSWIPFLVLSFSAAVPVYFYFTSIDFNWYRELIIQSTAGDMSPAELDMMRNSMQQGQILWVSVIGVILSSIIANAVLAAYLYFATRNDEECVQGFTDWYGFTWWINMPSLVFNILAFLIVLFAANDQLFPTALGPTSLAFIFSVDLTSSWFSLAQSIRLEIIWVIYLMAVGISQWTQYSSRKSYVIAILPFALIWTLWAGINLFF